MVVFGVRRGGLAVLLALVVVLPVAMVMPASAASSHVSWTRAKVVRWVDGDTVRTTKGTIRLIGVDTPERGRCGYKKANRVARSTAPSGTVLRLGNPRSVDNRDRYGRKLRYVVKRSGSVDLAAKQIRRGSKARYDSRDGYDWHPRQGRYRRIDRTNADYRCGTTSSGGSYAPISTYRCPSYAPIKGNEGSWIYHPRSSPWYAITTPEQCFATEAAARAAGFRRANY
jgi:endonuclease YncB( thermonuclease family)